MFDLFVLVFVAGVGLYLGHRLGSKGIKGFFPGGKSGRDTPTNKL